MPKIGIISVPKKKPTLTKRLLKAAVLQGGFGIMPQFQPIELMFTASELQKMGERKKMKTILKAVKLLREAGADDVVLTKECKAALKGSAAEYRFIRAGAYGVPCSVLCGCFAEIYEKLKIRNCYTTLVIYDKELKAVSFKRLACLCSMVRYITIYTDEIKKCRYIADKLLYEYGIMISVKEYKREVRRPALMIDAEKKRVGAGDLMIDGAEFDVDTAGYNIDTAEVAACVKDGDLQIKNWLSGNIVIKCDKNK